MSQPPEEPSRLSAEAEPPSGASEASGPPAPAGPAEPSGPAGLSGLSAEEILDIVDEDDNVVGTAPRGVAYAQGLRHRATFILARDAEDRIFVHRRTAHKLVFPSCYDMFVGGVLGSGETYDEAALREAEEELGVSGLPRPTRLFKFRYDDASGLGGWWSTVYEVRCDGPVHPQAEEVAWHTFLTEAEVAERLDEWDWVPDGLAAYQRLLRLREAG